MIIIAMTNDIAHDSLTTYTVLDAPFMVYYLITMITLKGRYYHHSCITDEKA